MRPRTWKWTAITVVARVMVQCGSKNSLLKAVSSWSKLTSLGSAARGGNMALLKALVNIGEADVRQKNSQGHNALDHVRISTGMVTDKHISLLSAPPAIDFRSTSRAGTANATSGRLIMLIQPPGGHAAPS